MTDIKMFTDPNYEPARDLDPQRLKQVQDARIKIADGAHGDDFKGQDPRDKMLCIMEATYYIIYGEDNITDAPPCTSESIRSFMVSINDSGLSDRKRAMLKAVIPDIINTAPTHWVDYGRHSIRRLRPIKKDPRYLMAEGERENMIAAWQSDLELGPGRKYEMQWDEVIAAGRVSMKSVIAFIRELAAVAKFDKQNAENDNKEDSNEDS